jgi:hypothetical protein
VGITPVEKKAAKSNAANSKTRRDHRRSEFSHGLPSILRRRTIPALDGSSPTRRSIPSFGGLLAPGEVVTV